MILVDELNRIFYVIGSIERYTSSYVPETYKVQISFDYVSVNENYLYLSKDDKILL